jgi:ATP-binding cassette, subfamily B, bacterial MsbA
MKLFPKKRSQKFLSEFATYKRLLGYVKPYKGKLILGVIFGIIFASSITGILSTTKEIFKDVFEHAPFYKVAVISLILPLIALIRGIGQYFSEYFIQWVGNRIVLDLRNNAFIKLQDLSISFFSHTKSGELISRTINDSTMVEHAVSAVLGDVIKQPFVLIAALGYVLWLDAVLAFAVLVLFPICLIPIFLFGKRVRKYARYGQERLADLVFIMHEVIGGIRIVKAFGMEDYEKKRFNREAYNFFSRIMRVIKAKAAIEPIIVFLAVIGLSLALLYARYVGMPAENFITFAIGVLFMYEPAKKMSKVHLHIQQTSAAADRIFEILDTPVTVKTKKGAQAFTGNIESLKFNKVSFSYDQTPILTDISFAVQAGKRLAIVGGSGAGKTTLVNLIPRFYDVDSGEILINNENIQNFTIESLRSNIGLVTQDTVLFNDTIANNISYGCSNNSLDKIKNAAERANADKFIEQMPESYDTIIGERGVRLSGGQRQRLAIARAILRNPPILILDEATSALDTESERLVQSAINQVMENRTVFAIAHRLSTISHCDNIIVLNNARIVESGSHAVLMQKQGLYKKLYDMQFNDPDNYQS